MAKPREGYHDLFAQIPTAYWDLLCEDAEIIGCSATQVLIRLLRRNYRKRVDPAKLPKYRRAGKPPEEKRD